MKRSLLIFAAFLFLFGADTKAGLPEGHNRRPNGGGGGGGGASYALKFNGSTSYVSIPYSSTLDMSTSFTIEFWVNIQDLTQTGKYIIARNGVNPSQQFGVLYGSVADSVEFYVGNGVGGDNPETRFTDPHFVCGLASRRLQLRWDEFQGIPGWRINSFECKIL